MESVKDKFLRYIAVDTQSAEAETVPSTEKQFNLARMLCEELKAMGASDVRLDEQHAYVYGFIPSNVEENIPVLGFVAHMDTSPALSGKDVKARCIANYDGKDICLNEEKQIFMRVEEFPELPGYAGKELIVTDGTTLLGADDKAGIAEIMTMAEFLLNHPEVPHGKIAIAFTPDEEVGHGVDFFDIPGFGAAAAYTVDGGALGGIEYETFNAAAARVRINGRSIHPGSAKNKMRNALRIALELDSLLPEADRPEHTEGYEGFYHLDAMNGSVESAVMDYIIRDHDRQKFEARKAFFASCCDFLNKKYGEDTAVPEINDTYYNLKDALTDHMDLIDRACEAMRSIGVEPVITPVRGGTDGCHLSYAGLPCPNLFTGGHNYHGKYEYIVRESMEKSVELLLALARK